MEYVCVCVYSMANLTGGGLQYCWISMFIRLYCILMGDMEYWQGAIELCGRSGMAGSVTEKQFHGESRIGRSVT